MPETKPVFKTPEEALASLQPLADRINAAADKTPSTVLNAMVPDQVSVEGFVLPRLTSRTWLQLEKIKSPFAAGRNPETVNDVFRAFFVMVNDPDLVSKAIASGEEQFSKLVEVFAGLFEVTAFPLVAVAVANHIARHFEPNAKMEKADEEGSGSGPLAPASSVTGPDPS